MTQRSRRGEYIAKKKKKKVWRGDTESDLSLKTNKNKKDLMMEIALKKKSEVAFLEKQKKNRKTT